MDKKKVKAKGETMIETAEENQFWAYEINNMDNKKDLVLLDLKGKITHSKEKKIQTTNYKYYKPFSSLV